MCYQCYIEADSPDIVNDKTKQAAELVKKLYDYDGCAVGGYAHIVTDDWNLEDDNIDFCLTEAIKGQYSHVSEEGRQACIELLTLFKGMTEAERYSALAIEEGFLK